MEEPQKKWEYRFQSTLNAVRGEQSAITGFLRIAQQFKANT